MKSTVKTHTLHTGTAVVVHPDDWDTAKVRAEVQSYIADYGLFEDVTEWGLDVIFGEPTDDKEGDLYLGGMERPEPPRRIDPAVEAALNTFELAVRGGDLAQIETARESLRKLADSVFF